MVNIARSSSRSWLLVAASAVALSAAPEAQAKCAGPTPMMAPWSGNVPPRPVLELLVPSWGAYEGQNAPPRVVAKAAGGSTPTVTVKPDTVASGLNTFRVEIGSAQAGPLQV